MTRALTDRQRRIIEVLEEHVARLGVPPSISELARTLGVTGATAHQHLKALERKGYLQVLPGRARGLRLLRTTGGDDGGESRTREIPILGRVAAGQPILAVENLEGTIHIDATQYPTGKLFALRVTGDSMTGAGIFKGDIVVVRPQSVAEPNEIVVAIVDDEDATVKRFRPHGRVVHLESENPDYPPIIRPASQVSICGKVVGVQRVVK